MRRNLGTSTRKVTGPQSRRPEDVTGTVDGMESVSVDPSTRTETLIVVHVKFTFVW